MNTPTELTGARRASGLNEMLGQTAREEKKWKKTA